VTINTRRALDIISASHDRRVSTEAWLTHLLEVARVALPPGALLALETNLTNAELQSEIVRGADADAAHASFLRLGHSAAPAWCVKATYGSGKSWISLRECVPEAYFQTADWLTELRGFGLRDMLAVVSRHHAEEQPSCALFSLCTAPARATRVERRLWEHIAVQLGAAQRLRRVVHEPPEAVLSPDGRLLHAVGSAAQQRDRLRDLVKAWEVTHRRIADRDAESSLNVWHELASGRWALVEQFDSDGQRYIVARLNRTPDRLRRLTPREREVATFVAQGRTNDWISVQLELTPPTVSRHVKNAQRKLGVHSRSDLLQLVSVARAGSEERAAAEAR